MFNKTELKTMESTLDAAVVQRNQLTEVEFNEFLPLFQNNNVNDVDHNALCLKYRERISLFHPVKVVKLNGDLVFELPPMFNNTDTINNNVDTEDPTLPLRAFVNAINRDSELTTDKERSTYRLINTMQKLQDKERVELSQKQHVKIMDKLIDKVEDVVDTDASNWDWE